MAEREPLWPFVRRAQLREAIERAERAENRLAGIDAIVHREREEISSQRFDEWDRSGMSYTDEDWAALVEQIDISNEDHGLSYTADDLKKAVRQHRRVRYGALNAIALVRYIESLEQRVAERV